MEPDFLELGRKIGELVTSKNKQYGDAATKSGAILAILYPQGIAPHQMADALLIVRVLDKLSRIAQRGADGRDLGGESPWQDLAGYGLLGWRKDLTPIVTVTPVVVVKADVEPAIQDCGQVPAVATKDTDRRSEKAGFRTAAPAPAPPPERKREAGPVEATGEKRCSGCGKTKARSEFNKNRSQRDGLQSNCRACESERWKTKPGDAPKASQPSTPPAPAPAPVPVAADPDPNDRRDEIAAAAKKLGLRTTGPKAARAMRRCQVKDRDAAGEPICNAPVFVGDETQHLREAHGINLTPRAASLHFGAPVHPAEEAA